MAVISHTCSPSPLSSPLPPHLFLPPAACPSHHFIGLFPAAGSLHPLLVSEACPFFQVAQPLPSAMAWALPFSSSSAQAHKQTRSTGLPAFWGGVAMATRARLPPDTTSGWRGAESPTHPKATHPVWFPSSMPPSSFPLTCWPPSPVQWARSQLLPPERQCSQHGRGGLLEEGRHRGGWFPNLAALFTGSSRDVFTNTGSQTPLWTH